MEIFFWGGEELCNFREVLADALGGFVKLNV